MGVSSLTVTATPSLSLPGAKPQTFNIPRRRCVWSPVDRMACRTTEQHLHGANYNR